MAHRPSDTTTSDSASLRHDFYSSTFDVPLKDARIISLRSLEHGGEAYEAVQLRRNSFWKRLLMSARRRYVNGKAPSPSHERLRLSEDEEKEKWLWRGWRRRRSSIICMVIPLLILCFFGAVHLVNVLSSTVHIFSDDPEQLFIPNWDQPISDNKPSYPEGLTRDVTPIPCHSHNDYWRPIPLYEALHYGCTGVEADVWLFDNELFVGHSTRELDRNKTFRSMYIDPLVTMLDIQNAVNEFNPSSQTKNGVFETHPSQTLVLLVDFKNYGPDIYPFVVSQLEALRKKNYLTYFDGKTTTPGPITVVATGNAPFDLITTNTTYRDVFFDAPLDRMYEDPHSQFPYHSHRPKFTGQFSGATSAFKRASGQGTVGTDENSHFDITNSYYASVSFKKSIGYVWWGRLSRKQMKLIRGQIQGAKRRGLKARYWGTPSWPVSLRNHVWNVLVREGVDYLNGDELAEMTKGDWRVKKHGGWLG